MQSSVDNNVGIVLNKREKDNNIIYKQKLLATKKIKLIFILKSIKHKFILWMKIVIIF